MTARGNELRSHWIIETDDGNCVAIENIDSVVAWFRERDAIPAGNATLWVKNDGIVEPTVLDRLLFRRRTHRIAFMVEWHGSAAAITFTDENDGENWVLSTNFLNSAVKVDVTDCDAITFGEPTPVQRRFCLPRRDAFMLILNYLHLGRLLPNLTLWHVG